MALARSWLTHHGATAILFAAVLIAAVTRISSLLSYAEFHGDEAVHATAVIGMRHGVWPTLGPSSSIASFSALPLYYYLIAPAMIFGDSPVAMAIPNALIAVATIPLLYFVVVRLLSGVADPRRRLIAAGAALWWSVTFLDLSLSSHEWNPSPIPFFTLAIVVLWAHQATANRSTVDRIVTAAGVGAVLAVLMSLHPSAMFVVPAVFVIVSAIRIVLAPRRAWSWTEPLIAVAVAVLALYPYWVGEAGRDWANTRGILAALHEGNSRSITQMVHAGIGVYFEVGHQFVAPTVPRAVGAFVILVLTLLPLAVLLRFRGDRQVLVPLILIWLVFLLAAANEPVHYPHYNLLIVFAPLLLTSIAFGSLNFATLRDRVIGIGLLAFVAVSVIANVRLDREYLRAKVLAQRPPSVQDISGELRALPAGTVICAAPNVYVDGDVVEYIQDHVARSGVRVHHGCKAGDVTLDARYEYAYRTFEDPELTDFRAVERPVPSSDIAQAIPKHRAALIEQNALFRLYRVLPEKTALAKP